MPVQMSLVSQEAQSQEAQEAQEAKATRARAKAVNKKSEIELLEQLIKDKDKDKPRTNADIAKKFIEDHLDAVKKLLKCKYSLQDLAYGLSKLLVQKADEYGYDLSKRKNRPVSVRLIKAVLSKHKIPYPQEKPSAKSREKNVIDEEKIKHDIRVLVENADWDGIKNYIAQLPDAHKKFCVETIKKIKEQDKKIQK